MRVMNVRGIPVLLFAALVAAFPSRASSMSPGFADRDVEAASGVARVDQPSAAVRFEQLQAAIRAARKRQDSPAYQVAANQLKRFLHAAPPSLLEVARADVQGGDRHAALAELDIYARMGQAADVVDTLPEFEPLRRATAYQPIAAALAMNRLPVDAASPAFALAGTPWLPEDIDYEPHARRFFFTSIVPGTIVSTAGDGSISEFARAPDGWPMVALKIDAARNRLWATEVAMSGFDTVKASEQGRSAILCYDLRTGALLRRVEGPRPSGLGDLVLTGEGDVIVSDGDHGGLYRLRSSADRLERLDDGDFLSPQTVAIAADGVHVFAPDYVRGIGVLDIRTRKAKWLSMKGRFAMHGIDGLYRAGRRLVAVQNGTDRQRIVVFTLDASGSGVDSERIIERATTTLGVPTHGVVVGDAIYYIADSGWDRLGENGLFKTEAAKGGPAVRRASLQP